MAKYTQSGRPLSITTPLGTDALLLEKLAGTEGISELFRFQLELLAEAPVAFEKLLGQPATLSLNLPNRSGRQVHGIIASATKGRRARAPQGGATLLRYRAELVPAAWLLTRRVQSRIFQHQTVPQILQTILRDEWQLNVVNRLAGQYPERTFCAQFRESDWAFVARLMEDEGIAFYFQHDDQGHHLVLADRVSAYAELPQFATVAYDETEGGKRTTPSVSDWEQTQEVGAYRYTLSDYHFEKPDDDLTAHRNAAGTVSAGVVSHPLDLQRTVNGVAMLEVYEPRGEFAYHHDGISKSGGDQPEDLQSLGDDLERRAQVRLEEEAAARLRIRGGGDCGHFLPGHQFQLTRHFDGGEPPGDADRYLLTRVELTASLEGVYTSVPDVQPVCTSRFECLPLKWPFRPRRLTPKPRIEGPQTATVTGPDGQSVHVDKYGRVNVHFHWDRFGPTDSGSSCWVRVGQFWAGNRFGAFFWPRVGQEVIVAFEEGNPDRPIIVGSVYNAKNMPPFELPGGVSASGIKSCSLGGKPMRDYNWLVFHDAADDEHVHIHSENHEIITSEGSRHKHTPGPSVEVMGLSPFALLSSGSGGGGGAFAVGSGSGGGMLDALDLAKAITGEEGPGWLQKFGALFPGSATFAWGSVISSSFLGDQVKHALLGANVTLTVDPEGILFDNIDTAAVRAFHGLGAGAVGLTTALLAGVGGNFGMTLGPNTSLTYYASNLGVTRGETYQYKAPTLFMDWGLVANGVKALTLLIAGGAIASDICGKVFGGASTQGGEWGILASRVFVQRFMGVLRLLEEENAIAETALAKTKEAADKAAEVAALLRSAAVRCANTTKTLIKLAKNNIDTALAQAALGASLLTARVGVVETDVGTLQTDVANTNKIFTGNYSIQSKNLSLTSVDPTPLNLSAVDITAGMGGTNGVVRIGASQEATMAARSLTALAMVDLICSPNGSATLINTDPLGTVVIQQGPDPVPQAKITLTGTPPALAAIVGPPVGGAAFNMSPTDGITLSVGAPGAGSSLALHPVQGVTLKFAAWSLTMNTAGITLTAGPNTLKVAPGSLELNGLLIKLVAQLETEQQAVSFKLTASALQQMQAALLQQK